MTFWGSTSTLFHVRIRAPFLNPKKGRFGHRFGTQKNEQEVVPSDRVRSEVQSCEKETITGCPGRVFRGAPRAEGACAVLTTKTTFGVSNVDFAHC